MSKDDIELMATARRVLVCLVSAQEGPTAAMNHVTVKRLTERLTALGYEWPKHFTSPETAAQPKP